MIPICIPRLCVTNTSICFQIFHKQLRTHPNGYNIFLFFNMKWDKYKAYFLPTLQCLEIFQLDPKFTWNMYKMCGRRVRKSNLICISINALNNKLKTRGITPPPPVCFPTHCQLHLLCFIFILQYLHCNTSLFCVVSVIMWLVILDLTNA